jgi:hypothetical protein
LRHSDYSLPPPDLPDSFSRAFGISLSSRKRRKPFGFKRSMTTVGL